MIASADSENLLFLASGATYVGEPPDVNEADRIEWIPLEMVFDLIAKGEIIGSASIIGLLSVLALRARQSAETKTDRPDRAGRD
jgi:hypothetical protein